MKLLGQINPGLSQYNKNGMVKLPIVEPETGVTPGIWRLESELNSLSSTNTCLSFSKRNSPWSLFSIIKLKVEPETGVTPGTEDSSSHSHSALIILWDLGLLSDHFWDSAYALMNEEKTPPYCQYIYIFPCCVARGIFLGGDWTHAPCSGSTES